MGLLKSWTAKNLLLLGLVLALVIFPLAVYRDAEFSGADGEAEKMVGQLRPDYDPWFKQVWEPPGGEVESLLFALQAALGSGFIGYYFGYRKGRKKEREQRDAAN